MTELNTPVKALLVRTRTSDDAVVRLQSEPLLKALPAAGWRIELFASKTADPEFSIVIFHYHDKEALAIVRQLRRSGSKFVSVCLCSDIYSFAEYASIQDISDLFLVPTELHRDILQSGVTKPVYVLPECYDPLVAPENLTGSSRPNLSAFWFGYAESFQKGMWSLVPIIKSALAEGRLATFDIVTAAQKLTNKSGFSVREFNKRGFSAVASTYSYTILSHLPLDLGLNSYIKSPNKLITALVADVVPIASSTPNYSKIMTDFGLHRFLFGSPAGLDRILRNLRPEYDAAEIRASGIREHILSTMTEGAVAACFIHIVEAYMVRDASERHVETLALPPDQFKSAEPELSFLLQKIGPSALNAFRTRLSKVHGARN